jgi:hypothetical protein
MSDKQSAPDLAQPLERQFEQLTEPFNRFVSNQTSGALLLLVGTLQLWFSLIRASGQRKVQDAAGYDP